MVRVIGVATITGFTLFINIVSCVSHDTALQYIALY